MNRAGYPEGYIGQHTLFERKLMQTRATANRWRSHPGMLIIMPEVDEQALHRELPGLPLPSKHLAELALNRLGLVPDTFGRLDMFNSVTNLMYDIAEYQPGSNWSNEAAVFAEHFENQRAFFSGALTGDDEKEARRTG